MTLTISSLLMMPVLTLQEVSDCCDSLHLKPADDAFLPLVLQSVSVPCFGVVQACQ